MSQRIPLEAIPNQQLTVRLDNRRYVITIKDIGDMMAVTIERDDVVLIRNVRACAGTPLLPYQVLARDAGNFIFTSTLPGEIPYYTGFESAFFLVFVTNAEIEASRNGGA